MSNLKKGSTIDGKVILTEPDLPVQKAGDQLLFGEHTVYTTGNKPSNEDIGSMPISGGTFTGKVTTKEINVPVGQKATFGTKSSIEEVKDGSLIVTSNNVKVGVDASTILTKDSIASNTINANTELKEKGNRVYSQNNTTNDKNGFVRLFGNAETALKTELDKVASDLANIDLTSIIVQNPGKNANVTMSQNATTIELDKKITGGSIVSESGSSNVNVMSQKATTDAIDKVSKESFKRRGTLGTLDLNTLSDANSVGVWFQGSNSNATTARHYPITEAGSLEVLQTAGITQRYTTYETNEVYIRNNYKYPGPFEFSEWVKQPSAKDTDKLSKDVVTAQKQADKGVSDAATALKEAQSKQDKLEFIGSGKVMKEGAYGLASPRPDSIDVNNLDSVTTRFTSDFGTIDDMPTGSKAGVVFKRGADITHLLYMTISNKLYTTTKWGDRDSVTAEIYNTSNTRADKNGVLHATTDTPVNTLNVSDMSQSVVNRDDITVTSGAVFRADNALSTRITTAQSKADSAHSLAASKTTEAWVKSQKYITAAEVPKGLRLGEVQEFSKATANVNDIILQFLASSESNNALKVGISKIQHGWSIQYRKIIE